LRRQKPSRDVYRYFSNAYLEVSDRIQMMNPVFFVHHPLFQDESGDTAFAASEHSQVDAWSHPSTQFDNNVKVAKSARHLLRPPSINIGRFQLGLCS
jgi:hypothetical protein